MRTYIECIPCFVRQTLDAARRVTDDAAIQERLLRETLRFAAEMPFDKPPPWMGQKIHRRLRELTGQVDPYGQAKQQANAHALGLFPALKRRIDTSANPFNAAVRMAIAGNIIDLGAKSQLADEEIHASIEQALDGEIDEEAVDALQQRIQEVTDILYLTDNAGEIVFDRLLIEQMPLERVTVVVKGAPIINDATRADAEAAGLGDLVRVIDNGSDVPGTILDMCSDEFRRRFAQADLIIAKGQGNYETLSEDDHRIVFLLKVKCPVIARDIGTEVGQLVIRVNDFRHNSRLQSQVKSCRHEHDAGHKVWRLLGPLTRFLAWWAAFFAFIGPISVCPFCGQPGCGMGTASAGLLGGFTAALITLPKYLRKRLRELLAKIRKRAT